MRIGIISDSHGRIDRTAEAVSAVRDAGAELILHLGDVETERVIDELAGHESRLVFGNCDWNVEALARHARHLDVTVDHPMGRIEIDGKRIAFTHGHLTSLMEDALADGVSYLLHGHSHELRDERVGATRIINPGALFRARRYTVGVLDPAEDRLEVLELPRSS